VWDND
jgi:hypothetical protein